MNLITTLVAMTIGFAAVAQADVITMECKTEKGTKLNIVYDNYSAETHKAELILLSIGGVDMKERLADDRFGTTGGKPRFGIVEFPKAGMNAQFSISGSGTYTVYKNGSFSGEEHNLSCEDKTPKAEKEDSSF